jgi:hypothetical protein
MREFLKEHPEEVESQRKGRAIWWDKKPEERAPAPSMRHAPRSGGAEHTFEPAGGYEWSFGSDDNAPPVAYDDPTKTPRSRTCPRRSRT